LDLAPFIVLVKSNKTLLFRHFKANCRKKHVPVISKPYHFIDSEEKKAGAIYRVSYLAKTKSKGYRDKQAKDYQLAD